MARCHTNITHMLNILSWLIGLVCLVLAIPLQLPVLGLALWIVLPVAVLGAGIGALSSSNGGRNLNLVVIVICILRLALTGGTSYPALLSDCASASCAALANSVGRPASSNCASGQNSPSPTDPSGPSR